MATIFFYVLFSTVAYAQDDAIGMDEEAIPNAMDRLEAFEYYSLHPIDLRMMSDELLLVPGISPTVLRSLKQALQRFPECLSIDALLSSISPPLDSSICQVLRQCTILSASRTSVQGTFRTRISRSIPDVKGFIEDAFHGSRESILHKLTIGNRTYGGVIVYGKQAGEPHAFGMIHGSLRYQKDNLTIIVGDHTLEHGMGTVLSSGIYMPDMSKPTARAQRWSTIIKPMTLLIEHHAFRGIGLQMRTKLASINMHTGLSVSMRNRHAYIDDEGLLTGFPSSTYARTQNEIEQRNAVREYRMALFNAVHLGENIFSIATLYQSYDHEIAPTAHSLGYNHQVLVSIDGNFACTRDWTMMSNMFLDNKGNVGAALSVHHASIKHAQAFMLRYSAPEMQSPLGRSQGRFGIPENDYGMHILMDGSLGSFNYAWSQEIYSQIHIPRNQEYLRMGMRMIMQCSKKYEQWNLLGRIIHEIKSSHQLKLIEDWRLRSEFSYQGTQAQFISRIEMHLSSQFKSVSQGIGYAFELQSTKSSSPWHWKLRMAWSMTDDFESAVYLPEAGLPGQLLIDPLFGLCTMIAGRIGYAFDKTKITILIRQKHKPLEQALGTGWMQILGNRETEFHVQSDITL